MGRRSKVLRRRPVSVNADRGKGRRGGAAWSFIGGRVRWMEGERGARARWGAFLVGATARRLAVEAAPMAGDGRKEQGKKRKGRRQARRWARASRLRSSGLRRRGSRPGACARQAEARGVRLGQASNGPRPGNQEGGEGMECWNEGGKEGWAFGPNERGFHLFFKILFYF